MTEIKKTVRIPENCYEFLEARDRKRFPTAGAYAAYLMEKAYETLQETPTKGKEQQVLTEMLKMLQSGQEEIRKELQAVRCLLENRTTSENEELYRLLDPSRE
jgi:hypothetical protein